MQRSIDPQLFEWPAKDPHLIGSECKDCGVVSFPRQASCPRCCGSAVGSRRLGDAGRLWTWTTQEFAPKSPPYAVARQPQEFRPFHLGYIEITGEVIIESRILAGSTALRIGMPMELVFTPLFTDANGDEVVCFAFVPAGEHT